MTIFDHVPLTPHGFCLAWNPALMALHVSSDAVIALAYFSISVALIVLLLRRRDVVFGWIVGLFAIFILACGTTHVFNIWTLWYPDYLTEGLVKAFTALVSAIAAVAMWPLIPRIVLLPSPKALALANQALRRQVEEYNDVVAALRQETAERMHTEDMLRQVQKMEAIGQLTGGLAHDFNNLLMVVRGNLEALDGRLENASPLRRYVERALSGADRAATLTQQLLAFARRQALSPRVFDINARIAAMADMLRTTLGTPGGAPITLEFSPGEAIGPVEADPNQLEAALLNLAINARDAMPAGGRLSIATTHIEHAANEADAEPDMAAGPYVRVSVTDTGEGMTPEVMHAAFEPFFTTKPVGRGSGLGLSQVYGFVRQSRGRIKLESTPGVGTVVMLDLPRAAAGLSPALAGTD
ncbi:MAG: hypothetical protein KGL12_14850 [Rhodospirillales bacterium]|nr:hypothetical protein [Rhodospirillales bacterium]